MAAYDMAVVGAGAGASSGTLPARHPLRTAYAGQTGIPVERPGTLRGRGQRPWALRAARHRDALARGARLLLGRRVVNAGASY
jgi:hypothetical protein